MQGWCHFQVYKQFFPDVAVGYEDPRVTLHVRDGKSNFVSVSFAILPSLEVPLYVTVCLLFFFLLQELHFWSLIQEETMMQ